MSYVNKNSKQKRWFNDKCKQQRVTYVNSKNFYRRSKTTQNFQNMKECSKKYKLEMRKARKEMQKNFEQKLRGLKSSNPKHYWNLLNSKNKKASKNVPDINFFYEHFKFLNEESTYPEMQINNNTRSVLELDKEISEEEILQAVKSLKNNKACGDDRVINEYIRSTIGLLLPVFKCIFNYVLETGNIPQDWTLGNIIPIYKKKGDTNDPGNYRGISLLSCFGKFFTTIINLRLNNFLNLNNILLENQIGFRKGYSTLNHVFSLKSLIDIFFSKKKKLYCAFIDFKKAFDTVWRSGLWIKLISFGITGKLFNVVRNIYDNVKSCVQLNKSFLKYNNVKNLFLSDNVFDNYLKILLYADDTVIFSETPEGLQKSLNCLAEYCKCRKLSINAEKTEIVIFSKARYRGNFNFKLNGKKYQSLIHLSI